MNLKLPKRVPQHISESASFKIFSSKIPHQWIIRDITERDYGIDCYLELVNWNNELTGELALIQLKSKQSIPWTKNNTFKLSGIDISTTNYWYKFPVPVFIFLVDIEKEEVFFKSVDDEIKMNFFDYIKQEAFTYNFEKRNTFDGGINDLMAFKQYYYLEHYRQQFNSELLFFLSNLKNYLEFQDEHSNRDFHLGIEDTDLIFFETMHRNYRFFCQYYSIENPIPSVHEIKEESRKKFKRNNFYELYEHDLAELMQSFTFLTDEIVSILEENIKREKSYWITVNPTLYNFILNIHNAGIFPKLEE